MREHFSEEEAINITIENGYDGTEFKTSVWQNRGCLKPNGTLKTLISKLQTIYHDVEVTGTGKKRIYILKNKKEQVTEREFNYKGSVNIKEYESLKIPEKHYDSIGVYIIQHNEDVYIGSTTNGFRNRFQQHYIGVGTTEEISGMLHNGGTFKILWVSEENNEPYIRQQESYFIDKYRNLGKFNLINKNHAWSLTSGRKKKVFKTIKVEKANYEKAVELLMKNNLLHAN